MTDSTLTLTLSTDAGGELLEVPRLAASITTGDGKVVEQPLGIEGLLVGTGPACQLRAEDPSLSREHARLSLTSAGVVLRDLASKNGCFLRGIQVREAMVPLDATVLLGKCQLRVVRTGESRSLRLRREPRFGEAVGRSPAMRAVFTLLEQAAQADLALLLEGESGTGKGVLARAVHAASPRASGPFVTFDCTASSGPLLEAELFGHGEGAFTGSRGARAGILEQAHGGTLFLDEVGELPLEAQNRLLRVLDDGRVKRLGESEVREVRFRVISATHVHLESAVAAGTFRRDLYFRLAAAAVTVPPLRERSDDLPLLVENLLARQHPPRAIEDLPPNALAVLAGHSWPGNVRELRNTILRWLVLPELGAELAVSGDPGPARLDGKVLGLPLREARDVMIARFERAYLEEKLAAHHGNVGEAADEMGVSRQLVYRLMERHQIKAGGR